MCDLTQCGSVKTSRLELVMELLEANAGLAGLNRHRARQKCSHSLILTRGKAFEGETSTYMAGGKPGSTRSAV